MTDVLTEEPVEVPADKLTDEDVAAINAQLDATEGGDEELLDLGELPLAFRFARNYDIVKYALTPDSANRSIKAPDQTKLIELAASIALQITAAER